MLPARHCLIVAHKPTRKPGQSDVPDVPVVPASLAVQHKRRRQPRSLLGRLVRAVAGTVVAAAVTTAGVVAYKEAEVRSGVACAVMHTLWWMCQTGVARLFLLPRPPRTQIQTCCCCPAAAAGEWPAGRQAGPA
jgi:hypothetical protein